MSETRRATVCGWSSSDAGCFVHLHFDDDQAIAQVKVDLHAAQLASLMLDVEVDVPAGDLTDPKISAAIQWRF